MGSMEYRRLPAASVSAIWSFLFGSHPASHHWRLNLLMLMQERPERKCHLCGALYKGPAILLPGKHRNGSGAGCRVSIVSAVQFIASFCFATQIIRSVRSCRPSRKVYFYFYLKHAIMQAIAVNLRENIFLIFG